VQDGGNGVLEMAAGITIPKSEDYIKEKSSLFGNKKGKKVHKSVVLHFFIGTYEYQNSENQEASDDMFCSAPLVTIINGDGTLNNNPTSEQLDEIKTTFNISKSPRDKHESESDFLHVTGVHESHHTTAPNVKIQRQIQNLRKNNPTPSVRTTHKINILHSKAEEIPNKMEDKARKGVGKGQYKVDEE
jgi:hypothetical protein